MKKLVLTIALAITIPGLIHGQWTQGEGQGYFKLSSYYLETDQHFTDTGAIDPNITRTQFFTSIYAQYGLGNRLDVVAYVPFFARATRNAVISGTTGDEIEPGEAVNSLGDINLGLDYNFYKKNRVGASVRLILGLPTGENSGVHAKWSPECLQQCAREHLRQQHRIRVRRRGVESRPR